MEWTKEKVKNFWEGYIGKEAEFQGELVADEVLRLSKKYIGKNVLDVGAGTGALIKRIPGAIGIDIVARPGILKGEINDLPFENERFDTVFATEVLEHLSDEIFDLGIKEIERCLKKNGYFIIAMPYDENLKLGIVKCPNCNETFHRMQHLRSFKFNMIKLKFPHFRIVKMTREPYDFCKKVSGFEIKYKHVRLLKPLLKIFKQGTLFAILQKR